MPEQLTWRPTVSEILYLQIDHSAHPTRAIDPDRPWVGEAFQKTRSIFVLGESYAGTYDAETEYDDVYWQHWP